MPLPRVWFERQPPRSYLDAIEGSAIPTGPPEGSEGLDRLASLAGSNAIIASSTVRYDAALFDLVPGLRVISRTGVGVDNIEIEEATKRGIAVCVVPDGPTVSTAEHTFALILAVAKRLRGAQQALEGGQRDVLDELDAIELSGQTLGIVGLGQIGGHVAQLGKAFNMDVMAWDPYVGPAAHRERGVRAAASLRDLLSACSIVTLHTPLTDETRHLIDAARLAEMRTGAILINTARGGLVDPIALASALDSGHLSGAGLDVFEPEKPEPGYPLFGRTDVVATPHTATATRAARGVLWRSAIHQALQVLRGERPAHMINPEVWSRGESLPAIGSRPGLGDLK